MRGTTTVSSIAVETSDGEMMRADRRSLAGFLRGEGPVHGLRHARQSSLGLRAPFPNPRRLASQTGGDSMGKFEGSSYQFMAMD